MILGSGLIQASGWPQASDWLIRDEFTDTVAAGSVNGTAATPGPGTRTVTDTESKMSVGSGVLALAGGKASPAWGDPGIWYGAQSRTCGLATIVKLTARVYVQAGFDNNQAGQMVSYYYFTSSSRIFAYGDTHVSSWVDGTVYTIAIVCRASGDYFFRKSGSSWVLDWIDSGRAESPLSPGVVNYSSTPSVDYLRCIALPAPFDTDDGLATDTHSGAVAAGTTFTHESDFWMEFTVTTLPSSGTIEYYFRMQDASNYWRVRITDAGQVTLYEVISGSSTLKANAAAAISNGQRMVAIVDNETIKIYCQNTLTFSYASAANFKTSTSGTLALLGVNGAVSDLKTVPLTLSGTAASIMNKVSA